MLFIHDFSGVLWEQWRLLLHWQLLDLLVLLLVAQGKSPVNQRWDFHFVSLYSRISPLTAPTGHSPGTKCSPAQSCAEPRGSVTLRECRQCPGAALHTNHRCSWQEFGLPCPQPRVENRRAAELCV